MPKTTYHINLTEMDKIVMDSMTNFLIENAFEEGFWEMLKESSQKMAMAKKKKEETK